MESQAYLQQAINTGEQKVKGKIYPGFFLTYFQDALRILQDVYDNEERILQRGKPTGTLPV